MERGNFFKWLLA